MSRRSLRASAGDLPARIVATVDETIRRLGDRLARTDPRVERALVAARERYARAYICGVEAANRLRYRAPPDPDRLVRVDPEAIERVVALNVSKFRLNGVVKGGDWDRTDTRFEEMDVFRSYRQHFREGVPWEETALFDRVLDEIEAGREPWGCDSREAFEARCERLDDLYESIRTDGYRTQAELAERSADDPVGDARDRTPGRYRDDIAVHIGRDGEFLFADGRNRLSIVKLLGVETVPVRVLLRHREWQAVREEYVRGRIDGEVDHPDLAGLDPG